MFGTERDPSDDRPARGRSRSTDPNRSAWARPAVYRRRVAPADDTIREWVRRASCRGRGVDPYFPPGGGSTIAARAVCSGCPVRPECLAYALADPGLQGVWGGMSDAERRVLRRRSA